MSITILSAEMRVAHLKTRMPFRYGIATMTAFPLVFLTVRARVEGQEVTGTASDLLPPKWFTKDPERSAESEIAEMRAVIQQAADLAVGLTGNHVFAVWRQLYRQQAERAAALGWPPLLAHFGTSLIERGLIEAACRQWQIPFAEAVRSNRLGIELGSVHSELTDWEPHQGLPTRPLERVTVRHTVGLGDPITPEEIAPDAGLSDGLPQALSDCVAHYGLTHFKLKVSGDLAVDGPRIESILRVAERAGSVNCRYTLDGNEQFATLADFREYWSGLREISGFEALRARLLFVEQPIHRDQALADAVGEVMRAWDDRPPLLIDESDGELESLPRALELGYCGTSHKNCKGVFKGILNRCLIEFRRRTHPAAMDLKMSGEDLCNQGPVALLQDLAVMATLGIQSVERNGHHYCRGLSAFSPDIQEAMLQAHGDLYHRVEAGWPSLMIRDGQLGLQSVNRSPFGIGCELPLDAFEAY